ncbi:MAG: hypothetical protein ACFB50_11555 [Rubrobacteraceae bacterium]
MMASNQHSEKATKAAEQMAQATKDSYMTFIDHAVGLQERNVRFVQGVMDEAVKEVRQQAESNRALAEELVDRVHGQREIIQKMVGEGVDAYMEIVYAPLSYYKEGLEAFQKVAR